MVYTTMRGRRSDSEEDENLLGSNLGKQKDIPETEYRQLGLQDNTDVVGLATFSLLAFYNVLFHKELGRF